MTSFLIMCVLFLIVVLYLMKTGLQPRNTWVHTELDHVLGTHNPRRRKWRDRHET
jgi:hypothetical protein